MHRQREGRHGVGHHGKRQALVLKIGHDAEESLAFPAEAAVQALRAQLAQAEFGLRVQEVERARLAGLDGRLRSLDPRAAWNCST